MNSNNHLCSPYVCDEGEFCETITHTCMDCRSVCDPRYQTPDECEFNCPGFNYEPQDDKPPVEPAPIDLPTESHAIPQDVVVMDTDALMLVVIVMMILLSLVVIVVTLVWKRQRLFSLNCAKNQSQDSGPNSQPRERGAAGLCGGCCGSSTKHSVSESHKALLTSESGGSLVVGSRSPGSSLPVSLVSQPLVGSYTSGKGTVDYTNSKENVIGGSIGLNMEPQFWDHGLGPTTIYRTESEKTNDSVTSSCKSAGYHSATSEPRSDLTGGKDPTQSNGDHKATIASRSQQQQTTKTDAGSQVDTTVMTIPPYTTSGQPLTHANTPNYHEPIHAQSIAPYAQTKSSYSPTSVDYIRAPLYQSLATSKSTMGLPGNESHLDLALRSSDRYNMSMTSSPPVPVSDVSDEERDHWNTVMRVYDHLDQHLHKMPWIAGCLISNSALKVVVNGSESTGRATEEIRRQRLEYQDLIRNAVPPSISPDRIQVTFEGPSLQTTSADSWDVTFSSGAAGGRPGSGNVIQVHDQEAIPAQGTVTAMARSASGRLFAITAGHVAHRGQRCVILNGKSPDPANRLTGKCVAHLDTSGGLRHLTDIKDTVKDLALIQLDRDCAFSNSRRCVLGGRSVTLKPAIQSGGEWLSVSDVVPGRRVLVFGGTRGVVRGYIDKDFACYTSAAHTRHHPGQSQSVNLIHITSQGPEHTMAQNGFSGSLVAWYPESLQLPDPELAAHEDDSEMLVSVKAFAVIVGANPARHGAAFAIPLEEQLCELINVHRQQLDGTDQLKGQPTKQMSVSAHQPLCSDPIDAKGLSFDDHWHESGYYSHD